MRAAEVKDIQNKYHGGIKMHRWIDEFTDKHPSVIKLNKSLQDSFGRYAPVASDIFFDHFLAVKWYWFTEVNFDEYCQQTYAIITDHLDILPLRLHDVVGEMVQDRWLHSFSTPAEMQITFNYLGKRAKFPNNFKSAAEIMMARYFEIESVFVELFPELITYCKLRMEEI